MQDIDNNSTWRKIHYRGFEAVKCNTCGHIALLFDSKPAPRFCPVCAKHLEDAIAFKNYRDSLR